MKTTPEHSERITKVTFASVYPHLHTKVEKKERLNEVIEWLIEFKEKRDVWIG